MLEHAALLSARCPSRAKGAAGFPSCDRGRKTSRPSRRCRIPLKQRCGGSPRRARRSGRRQSPPSQGTGPPERSGDLSRDTVPGGLSRGRLHRIPRVVEFERPDPQRGYNVVFQPLAKGARAVRGFRQRLCRGLQGSGKGGVPSNRVSRGPGRRAPRFRRCSWPYLAHTTMETARTRSLRRRRPRLLRRRLAWRCRPRGRILKPAEAPLHCRPLPARLWVRWRSATGSFMARPATARAADVTGQTAAAASSGHPSIQAIG